MVYLNFTNQGPMINLYKKLCFVVFCLMAFSLKITAQNIDRKEQIKEPLSQREAPGIAVFTPPKGWRTAEQNALSPHIKVLVVGPKLQNEMPPTMNLMIEPYDGTLKTYLKSVKKINDSHGDAWKDLGTLKTKAGDASLSQVEIRSKWGGEKLMHAIIVKKGYAYVLTASASKSEFGRFYQQFYTSLRSLQIFDNPLDIITEPNKRKQLEAAYERIQNAFNQSLATLDATTHTSKELLFQSTEFQNNYWQPFKASLERDYAGMGTDWQETVLNNLKEKLLKN